jgi:hypothetical protein
MNSDIDYGSAIDLGEVKARAQAVAKQAVEANEDTAEQRAQQRWNADMQRAFKGIATTDDRIRLFKAGAAARDA